MKKRNLAVLLALLWVFAPGTPIAAQTKYAWAFSSAHAAKLQQTGESAAPAQAPATLLNVGLTVSTSANPEALPEPGGFVTFSISIFNPLLQGSVLVTQLQDSLYGNITTPGHDGVVSTTCGIPQLIDQLGEYTCSFVAIVTGNAGDQHTNKLKVYAQDGSIEVVVGETSATVTITDVPSSLVLKKRAHPTQIPESGAGVTYTIWVTNTSPVDSIRLNKVNDDRFGDVSNSCRQPLPVTLPAAGAITCTFSRLLQGQAGTIHVNTATATGVDDDKQVVSANDKATVIFLDTPGVLTMSATAAPTAVPEAGGPVTFTLRIKNESSVDAITVKSLTDPQGKVTPSCQPALNNSLKAGEVMSCHYIRSIQGDFGTTAIHQITANGTSDDGQAVTANAEVQITFTDTPASLTVQKTPSQPTASVNGAVITFTVQVKNTSPTDSLTLDQITDSRYGNVAAANPLLVATTCTTPQILPVNGQYTCKFSAGLSGAIGAVHTNLLTVKATDDDNVSLQAQASANVTIVGALIRATKRDHLLQDRNGDGVASPGDTIGYTVVISNGGNLADSITFTDRLDNNTRLVTDQVTSSQGVIATSPLSLTVHLGALAPATVATINFPVTVVNPLPVGTSQVGNQGFVVGDLTPALPTNDPDTPTPDDPTATLVVAHPRLVAAKRAALVTDVDGDGVPSPGDTISYTIRLVNVGNQQAVGVEVHDPLDVVTTLVSGSTVSSQGQVVTGTSGQPAVSVQLGDLAVGATAAIDFQAVVVNPLPAGISQISNQARFIGTNIPPGVTDDPSTTAADDPTRLFLTSAPLVQLTKRDLIFTDADGDNTVSAGDILLYTLRLSNLGNTSALNLQITDTPDLRTTLLVGKVQASGGQILAGNAPNDRSITLAVPELLPQQRVDLAFRVVVNAAGAALLSNQASGRYSHGGTQAEITFVSDDPDTPQANDPTNTPVGGVLASGNNRAFLPLIRRR